MFTLQIEGQTAAEKLEHARQAQHAAVIAILAKLDQDDDFKKDPDIQAYQLLYLEANSFEFSLQHQLKLEQSANA